MKAYLKCAKINIFTLGGYFLILVGLISLTISTRIAINIISLGVGLLFATNFGLKTYFAYRKTQNHIKAHGRIDDRFFNRFSSTYCNFVGLKLAAEEAGVEESLKQN